MSLGVSDTATHTHVSSGKLEISNPVYRLVTQEILPDLHIDPSMFWSELETLITELAPKNNILLLKRYKLQAGIDTWHQSRCDAPHDPVQYKKYLQKIGYLLPEGPDFEISPTQVDDEIATISGGVL